MKYFLAFLVLMTAAIAWSAPYQVTAWTFGDAASLQGAADRAAIDEVDVDWYLSQADLTLKGVDYNPDFVAAAHSRGLTVFATVSNWSDALNDFDPDLAANILASPIARSKHIKNIVKICTKKGYDGIDLDWESMHPADKDRFSSFVAGLAKKLHRKGKVLSIAVHPKTTEPGDWDGPKSQDWVKLGAAVDEFKIMTYDYSGPWSDPGPIGPPAWADDVLTHAESLVPAAKIMMGVPFYGYDWRPGGCDDLDWTGATGLISTYTATVNRDASGEATFNYVDGSAKSHTAYFQDRTAIAAKLQMLLQNHPAIRGIAIWRMGGEDPAFWDEIVLQLR